MASRRKTRAKRKSRHRSSPPRSTQAAPGSAVPTRIAHPEFEMSDEAIERSLRTGEHQGLLEDYFGSAQYAEMRELSREAASRGVRGGPKVLILPGIMGSKIGRKRKIGLLDDVFWFDPLDIAVGRMTVLALGGSTSPYTALGVLLITYLKLKLRLLAAGYDAEFHPFDWRLSIDQLGKQLADRMKGESDDIDLVAHSMGGLVARAAIAQGASCRRLIMLGTPNFGSFAPVMALRAAYPVVRKVAALDAKHTAEELVTKVFSTFPGLTQMLPSASVWSGIDLYDLTRWPADELRPRETILRGVRKVQDGLAPGAPEFHLIAGIDQRTPTGVRVGDDGAFIYEFSNAGDGTVPLDFARLPGIATTHYIAESHGSLPNNRQVAHAVIDLLAHGSSDRLPTTYVPGTRTAAVPDSIPEAQLRIEPYEGRRGAMLSQRELRHLLEEVAAPDAAVDVQPLAAAVPALVATPDPGFAHRFDRVVVGRRRQHRVDVRFARGSITEVDAKALVVGIFRGVTPAGAASALDRRLGGAITEVSQRRMFAGGVGEVFMLPTGRHPITADLVSFVGLGEFDRVNDEVLRTAADNLLRTFIHARIDEFATVLFGSGSTESPASALRNLLLGFTRALVDADTDHHFRRIVICEKDPDRYAAMKEEMFRLSSTPICADVELTFDEIILQAEPVLAEISPRIPTGPVPVYLIVRQERTTDRGRSLEVRSSILTAGAKATVVTGAKVVDRDRFESLRRRIISESTTSFSDPGRQLSEMLLADEVAAVMSRFEERHLVVVHDSLMSRVPWEVLALPANGSTSKSWFPAAGKGLSHRYAADHLSVAKWLEARVKDNALTVLLVADPTEDLPGAEAEGRRIAALLSRMPAVKLTEIWHGAATRPALLDAFRSGELDVLHYAGHASFDERDPGKSGILCAGGDVLSGADLAGLGRLPALVFFNACEAARVRQARGTAQRSAKARTARERLRRKQLTKSVGLAEAFMRGGVANFLGTYWPVADASAKMFAERFYGALLSGEPIGAAIQQGRLSLYPRQKDWANYVFYGDAEFRLKDV